MLGVVIQFRPEFGQSRYALHSSPVLGTGRLKQSAKALSFLLPVF